MMTAFGHVLKESLPKELGFALLVFPLGGPGISNYVSNGTREDMIKALRETADRLEKNQDFKTPSKGDN